MYIIVTVTIMSSDKYITLINYIKTKYPEFIQTINPVTFSSRKALAFIVDADKLVVGYINSNGLIKNLLNPIKLNQLNDNHVPLVEGITEKDNERIIEFIRKLNKNNLGGAENKIKQYCKNLERFKIEYQQKYNIISKETIKYKSLYKIEQDKYNFLQKEYSDQLNKLENLQNSSHYSLQYKTLYEDISKKLESLNQSHKDELDKLNERLYDNEKEYKDEYESEHNKNIEL